EDGIGDRKVTGVQTCALPILATHTTQKPRRTRPQLLNLRSGGGVLGRPRFGRFRRLSSCGRVRRGFCVVCVARSVAASDRGWPEIGRASGREGGVAEGGRLGM